MMSFRRLLGLIKQETVPPQLAALGITAAQFRELRESALRETAKPPRIALIGETGVGKSSTINALFNAGRAVSHTEACTTSDGEVHYRGSKGEIIVVDMPGLGESIDADEAHLRTYKRVLPTCDVTLWILKADNRAITNIQRSLEQLTRDGVLDSKHLVIGLNQIDLLQPGEWNVRVNQPSEEQERTIAARTADVEKKLRQVCALNENSVIPYSALKGYALDHLVTAMLAACDRKRQWLLFERADCADFTALVEPDLLQKIQGGEHVG